MKGRSLPPLDADAVGRLVRALGSHRYVAGRAHAVHAFVFEALEATGDPELGAACAWARATLADASIDPGSRDPRLLRAASDRELAAALGLLWGASPASEDARERLEARLESVECNVPDAEPFDESVESEIFPVLVDAGWELLPLWALDAERHRGVIEAYNAAAGDPLGFEAARFEETSSAEPTAFLQELPALGPREILAASADGALLEPLVLWTSGADAADPYHGYVLRGVLRAAKIG